MIGFCRLCNSDDDFKYILFLCGEKYKNRKILRKKSTVVKKETEYIFCSQLSKVSNKFCIFVSDFLSPNTIWQQIVKSMPAPHLVCRQILKANIMAENRKQTCV